MNSETFVHDVFLSHSAKDKAVVRPHRNSGVDIPIWNFKRLRT